MSKDTGGPATDRELLGLAAKAAGAEHNGYRYGEHGREPLYGMPVETEDGTELHNWNPLTDDGDALRLAVKLKIDVDFKYGDVWATEGETVSGTLIERCGDDPDAATRRAIVRAAAEIGKAMP